MAYKFDEAAFSNNQKTYEIFSLEYLNNDIKKQDGNISKYRNFLKRSLNKLPELRSNSEVQWGILIPH